MSTENRAACLTLPVETLIDDEVRTLAFDSRGRKRSAIYSAIRRPHTRLPRRTSRRSTATTRCTENFVNAGWCDSSFHPARPRFRDWIEAIVGEFRFLHNPSGGERPTKTRVRVADVRR